ncbi:hypothetical protein ACODM8_04310 [Vibrio ostreicida]|uniref:Aminoglycoside phosphotransferase domain-containing protein n=1 Tax=Vibrio ostreicida TaxID=526588 RepID=A0ABT8BW99_9VIBR|nr:hypothetical protein [Vibrio ostreicida]MDN3610400.1 hypothetical protein [Vibrio ostreicida]NPD07590.1 hypothetical protein [Vibrio ostreicida]
MTMKSASLASTVFHQAMPDWHVMEISGLDIESINDNYRVKARSASTACEQQFFMKLMSETERVAPSYEPFIHELLDGRVRHTLPMTCSGEWNGQRYFITEFVPETLELLDALTNEVLSQYWAQWSEQIVTFIEDCATMTLEKGYGFIDKDVREATLTNWQSFLEKNLDGLANTIEDIVLKHGSEIGGLLKKLHQEMKHYVETQSQYWCDVPRVLVPIDLNLRNFLVHQSELYAIDLETFVIGDPLLAYGEFMGHIHNTPFSETFKQYEPNWTVEQNKQIHFYALLSNLNVFCFVAASVDKGVELDSLKPWGNTHSFIALMQEHHQVCFGVSLNEHFDALSVVSH